MICFTISFVRQLYHFAADMDRVLLQLVGTDIENSLYLNTEWAIGIWHSWLIHFNSWRKDVKNLIRYSCIFNVQLHVHLKKWTLKFKPLYRRNYTSYFNRICRISCVNTHIKSLAQIHTTMTEIQHFFPRDCFFMAHSVCVGVCVGWERITRRLLTVFVVVWCVILSLASWPTSALTTVLHQPSLFAMKWFASFFAFLPCSVCCSERVCNWCNQLLLLLLLLTGQVMTSSLCIYLFPL